MYLGQQGHHNNKIKQFISTINYSIFQSSKKKKTYISQIKVPTHFLDKHLVNKISIDKRLFNNTTVFRFSLQNHR